MRARSALGASLRATGRSSPDLLSDGVRRRWRVPVIVLVAVVALVTVLESRTTSPGCVQVHVVAVRGTDQPPGSGAQIDAVVSEWRVRGLGDRLTITPVVYPATTYRDPLGFASSVDDGVEGLGVALQLTPDGVCADADVVVMGYSQGALVVRQFMDRVTDGISLPDVNGVSATVLIADPLRAPDDVGTTLLGTAGGSGGLLGSRPPPIGWPGTVVSVCNAGDITCASSIVNVAQAVLSPSSLAGVHGSSYLAGDVIDAVVTALMTAVDGAR